MPSSTLFCRWLLRTAVALPLCTLAVCYAIKQPQWPLIHPSAVFDYGMPRVIATLGFSISAPFMTGFGAVRYVRDLASNDSGQCFLRGGVFFCVIVGLLGVAAVPWHVSQPLHTAFAVSFFSAAAVDIIVQRTASARRSLIRAHDNRCGEILSAAARWVALAFCLASVAGQVTQFHPLMGIGECGFAVLYLVVLGFEERELEQVGVQLLPWVDEDGTHGDRTTPLLQNN